MNHHADQPAPEYRHGQTGTVEVLDTYQTTRTGKCSVTSLYVTGTREIVRVHARYDTYEHQSHAIAEILTPDRHWTTLLQDPSDRWHHLIQPLSDPLRISALAAIATNLAVRADRLLTRVGPRHREK